MEIGLHVFSQGRLVVAPLGDIQWNGDRKEIAYDALRAHIDRAIDREAWFLGMGDYIDFMSPSNRQRLDGAALYDGAIKSIDARALELTHQVAEILAPTKGRWLGLLSGHHFAQLRSGDTTDMRLASMLEAPFLGTSAFVGVRLQGGGSKGGYIATFSIWCHHGMGSGKAHAPILKLENLSPYWDADVFLIGHMTKVAAAPIERIRPLYDAAPPRLKHKKIILAGTGGWSKGYMEGARDGLVARGNYVEQKMLNPVCLGAPLIELSVRLGPSSSGAPRSARGQRVREWHHDIRVEV